jgi:hypothetical protein
MRPGRTIINELAQQVVQANISTEILYSFIIIVCSLMIYYGTKEIYELSSYKGIKYFRMAFLFFALAYFFRSSIKLILFYFNVRGIFSISPKLLNPLISHLTLILFMYFSAMAIFYLLFSVMYKKWNYENRIYLFHIVAVFLAVFSVISRNPFSYLGLNLLLLVFVLVVVYISYKNSKKKTKGHNLYVIYILLLFFWILNIVDILIPTFFQNFQLLIYLISSGIFLLMLYKVLKKVGSS